MSPGTNRSLGRSTNHDMSHGMNRGMNRGRGRTLVFAAVFTFFLITMFLLILLAGRGTEKESVVVEIGDVRIVAEVRDTAAERAQGLSGRAALSENRGMLFVFNEPGRYRFWMKDMLFPVDIIWIDENLRVAYVHENISPETFPETFSPPEPVQYVLEVRAGTAAQKNITQGTLITY